MTFSAVTPIQKKKHFQTFAMLCIQSIGNEGNGVDISDAVAILGSNWGR